MNILHLTLYKKWFDQIEDGRKPCEVRLKTPYWTKRLAGKTFNEVWFRNGYSKTAPFMRVEWKGMTEDGNAYFIWLGKVLEVRQ